MTEISGVPAYNPKYQEIFHNNAIAQKYGYDISCYVLTVFDEIIKKRRNFDHRNSAIDKSKRKQKIVGSKLLLKPNFSDFKPAFIFNIMENVRTDITQGWSLADGKSVLPF